MTSATCPTGTDRVAEVVSQLEESFAIILNIQGDEPCIDPDHIDTVAALLQENETEIMGTAATRITSEQEAWDRNVVKCVVNIHGYALYFSRALIPHSKEGVFHPSTHYLRHLGIYAFRREFLLEFPHLPPCPIQEEESLEQLKVLYSGHRIRVAQVSTAAPGIDTREHLHRVERAGTQKE